MTGDPWYADNIDNSLATCWPSEALSWWSQSATITTELGTSFLCPSAYQAVTTQSVDSYTTRTLCCPSSYGLHTAEFDRPSFPSQCTSTVAAGETFSWEKIVDVSGDFTWTATSTTVASTTITVFGVPINGLNVAASSSSSSSSTTTTASSDKSSSLSSSSATSSSIASSTSSGTSSTSSSDTGGNSNSSIVKVAVGASVGAVAGILALVGAAFFLWRRRRQNRSDRFERENPPLMKLDARHFRAGGPNSQELDTPSDGSTTGRRSELKGAFPDTHQLAAYGENTDPVELVGNNPSGVYELHDTSSHGRDAA